MLTKKLLVTIFFLLLVSTAIVCADINVDVTNIPPLYEPGDNIQTSITIHISDNYTDKVTIPIPRIYTVDQYNEGTYGNEDINLEAYKYLTVEVRFKHLLVEVEYTCTSPDFNLVDFTLNFKEGVPTSKEISISYFFEPPVGAFPDDTHFAIEYINDINLEGEDLSLPEWFIPAVLIIAIIVMFCLLLPILGEMVTTRSSSSSSSGTRRTRSYDSFDDTRERLKHTPKYEKLDL